MKHIPDSELEKLGFKLEPKIVDECSDGFAYRVAKIEGRTSFIEIVNEYQNDNLMNQHMNFEIIEDGKPVNLEFIKKFKKILF